MSIAGASRRSQGRDEEGEGRAARASARGGQRRGAAQAAARTRSTGRRSPPCKAWAIADGRTGEVLWGHREKEPLEMASTTKIMTALIVVRLMAKDPKVGDELVTFSRRADRTIGSSADVHEGERLPVRELLYGLLLPSGNDAAVAFGEHFGGRLKPPDDAPEAGRPAPPVRRRDEPRGRRARPARDAFRQPQRPARAGAPLERARPGQAGPPCPGRARVRRGRLDPEARLHAGRRPGEAARRRLDEYQSPARHRGIRRRQDRARPRPPAPASWPAAVAARTT